MILCAGTARAVLSVAQRLGYIPAEGTGADRIGGTRFAYLIDRLARLPLAARRKRPAWSRTAPT